MTLALFALLLVGNLNAQFSGGSGTEADPYQIASGEDMVELADSVNNSPFNDPITYYNWSRDKYFKVMKDIDDSVRTVIGFTILSEYAYFFQGDFNGNNKKIILAIDEDIFVGLFSVIYDANIYDLIIDGYVHGRNDVGGICGYNLGSNIINCVNYCKTSGMDNVGGICGSTTYPSYISNCINYGNIEGKKRIGGISGNISSGNIENCFNYGYVNGSEHIGGVCGVCFGSGIINCNLSNCFNYGYVIGKNIYAGGIAGFCGYGVNISNCKNESNVVGNKAVGGITGCFGGNGTDLLSELSNCVNSGNIVGVSGVGGISGHLHYGDKIFHCVNIGTIKADSIVGGIVGGSDDDNLYFDSTGNIYNSVNSGLIIGKKIVGGIMGRCFGEIKNCINTGVVKGNTKVGCIVGEIEGKDNQKGTIINCHYDKQMCGSGE